MIPDWYELVILSLATFRIWRLLAEDTILDGPRRKLLRFGDWRKPGDPYPPQYRQKMGEFFECPWCMGFWIGLGMYLLWYWFPTETLGVGSIFAISAIAALVRTNLDPPEEED